MHPQWHMHVSKVASAVAVGVPVGNVMGLHCLLQSQATVTLHLDKRMKQQSSNSDSTDGSSSAASSSCHFSTLNGGNTTGDM
jgi:hypothetical protein